MNTRKLLINAIISGNIEELRRLKRLVKSPNPITIILSGNRDGKYHIISGVEGKKGKELTQAEYEDMQNDPAFFIISIATWAERTDISEEEKQRLNLID